METGEIIRTIFTEFPYALFGSILVGTICSFLGVYIVSKRVVFLGAVLTQVSVLGIALTFLPFLMINHTLGSMSVTLISVIIFAKLLTGKKIPRDAMLGISFVSAIAFRILILQKTPKVEAAEIENLLRGDILFITPGLFYEMSIVFFIVMIIHTLFFKEFSYISFDPETAQTQGYKSSFWEIFFYVTAGVVISVATHMVGDIFVFGFLVAPPVAAMLLAKKVKSIFIVSIIIGALTPIVGLFLAFKYDFPSSPIIVACAFSILGVAWIINQAKR